MNLTRRLSLICFSFFLSVSIFAQQNNLWRDISELKHKQKGKRQIVPQKYRTVSLDLSPFKQQLKRAPLESPTSKKQPTMVIAFPMPDGSMQNFNVVESPVMERGLAIKYPEMKTYLAKGIDDPYATMRFDVTHKGFHGIINSPNGMVFIDPYSTGDTGTYISYYKNDYVVNKNFSCLVKGKSKKTPSSSTTNSKLNVFSNGDTLRSYRLAVAATGEYTTYHGGTVADGLAAIVTTINRVNQVYENDLAIRLILIANNNQIIYTNGGSDPFVNNNAGVLIGQSQTVIDNIIGSNNYDVGHTVSTGGGGLANLNVPCKNGSKAKGITGSSNPVGDPYDIDYVAHEIGHQFGGNHTFNGSSGNCGGNISSHSYEPGSGSTIQAYAGICSPQNLQSNSDPYFHYESLREILAYATNSTGDNCAAKTPTGNTPPVASHSMATSLTIPVNTPFELTGEGNDVDNDALTYCWEQFDLGPQGAPESPSGNAPIFRSWNPDPNPVRTFPKLSDLLVNAVSYGEILPSYTRSLEFRLTVRDNSAGGGGVHCASYSIDVDDNAGPFLVTSPNTAGIVWFVGFSETINWNVANTTAAPVSCANVDIILSTDGGATYPITLASGVPNNGAAIITVPNNLSTTVRVKVICSDNIFFDISNQNLEIEVPGPDYVLSADPTEQSTCIPDDAVYTIDVDAIGGYTDDITFNATGLPTGATATFSPTVLSGGAGSTTVTLNTSGVDPGNYPITIEGVGPLGTRTTSFDFIVLISTLDVATGNMPMNGAIDVLVSSNFSWNPVLGADSYEIEISTDPGFVNMVESASGLTTTVYNPTADLVSMTQYYWRIRANNLCGMGSYSPSFSLITENIVCMTYASTDIPITISISNAPTITSTLSIPDNGIIRDVNVLNLTGQHTWINDLDFALTSPAATNVGVIDRSCHHENDFDLNLDDAGSGVWPCPPTDGGTYPPSEPLSGFNGEDLNGVWTLTVNDNVTQDGGSLDSWSLEICYSVPSAIELPIKLFLEGPYDGTSGLMKDDLRAGGYIPLAEPFTGMGYIHVGGGGESTTQMVLDVIGSIAIVDWILIELRDASDNTNIVATQTALLRTDGSVVATDGIRSISFPGFNGDYYISIQARNHLAVMTGQAVTIDDGSLIDFTDPGLVTFGNNATEISNGVSLLHAGDATNTGEVDAGDRSKVWNERNQSGYMLSDVNMDGSCDAADRSITWNKRNKLEELP